MTLRVVEEIIGQSTAQWGIYAKVIYGASCCEVNADSSFYAASLAKIPIVAAALDRVEHEELFLEDSLRLSAAQKRPGTGILQHFPEGWEVTVGQALALMLIVSDNTAAKMVVDRLGAANINAYLRSLGLTTTQLELQPGGKFTYGYTTPREFGDLLESVYQGRLFGFELTDWMVAQMQRCRFPLGMRRGLEGRPKLWWLIWQDKASRSVLRLSSRLKLRFALKWILAAYLSSSQSKLLAHKEGSLDDMRHEVAIVLTPRPYLLAIFSSGLEDQRYSADNEGVLTIARLAQVIRP